MQATEANPLVQFSKFNNFLWVCWFLGIHLSNFVPPWKLDNPYYHRHTVLQCVLNFFAPLVPSLCPYLQQWCSNHSTLYSSLFGSGTITMTKFDEFWPTIRKPNKSVKSDSILWKMFLMYAAEYSLTWHQHCCPLHQFILLKVS